MLYHHPPWRPLNNPRTSDSTKCTYCCSHFNLNLSVIWWNVGDFIITSFCMASQIWTDAALKATVSGEHLGWVLNCYRSFSFVFTSLNHIEGEAEEWLQRWQHWLNYSSPREGACLGHLLLTIFRVAGGKKQATVVSFCNAVIDLNTVDPRLLWGVTLWTPPPHPWQ